MPLPLCSRVLLRVVRPWPPPPPLLPCWARVRRWVPDRPSACSSCWCSRRRGEEEGGGTAAWRRGGRRRRRRRGKEEDKGHKRPPWSCLPASSLWLGHWIGAIASVWQCLGAVCCCVCVDAKQAMTSTGEVPVLATRAAVYFYNAQSRSWDAADSGSSRIFLFHNPGPGTYRVIAMSDGTDACVINSPVFKGLKHQRVSDLFLQWRDTAKVYGLSFGSADEADAFSTALQDTVRRVASSTVLPPPLAGRGGRGRGVLPPPRGRGGLGRGATRPSPRLPPQQDANKGYKV